MDITKLECENKTLNNSGFMNEDDYFKCSDLSANSENDLDELLTKMNISKSKQKEAKKFKILNEFSKNDFEIIGFLGKGNFAQVLKARNLEKNSIHALKIVDKPFLEKEDKLYQVFVENEVLRVLEHPNVIKIQGIFEENDKIYTVLDYCSAGDFFELIKNNCIFNVYIAPLRYETAQFFTAKIINVLEYLHNLGVIHRDIKPENILLDDQMNIKLVNN